MTEKTKNIINKIILASSWFFFALAVFLLYRQLSKHSLGDLIGALFNLPLKNLLLACGASFLAYIALSSYDYLGLRYVGKKMPIWKWMLVGFISFAISNNAGHAVVSGGSMRYRLYTRWELTGSEVLRMVLFSGFTYLVACFALVIMGYHIVPDDLIENIKLFDSGVFANWGKLLTVLTVIFSYVGLAVYLGMSIFFKKTLTIKGVPFPMPNFKLALMQVIIGGIDILVASLVLYFTLSAFIDIPFHIFIGAFVIAQVLGAFSQVPGGLGVFETMFLAIIPSDDETVKMLFAALIAYRIIYYLFPLAASGIVFLIYEKISKNATSDQ